MNNSLKKQIKTYTGIAGALLAADKASGQIVYHDINPDTIVSSLPANSGYHYYKIDVTGDSIMDFGFRLYSDKNVWGGVVDGFAQITVTPFGYNKLLDDSIVCPGYLYSWKIFAPVRLSVGDTIKKGNNWRKKNRQLMFGINWSSGTFSTCGDWGPALVDRFLGINIFKNNKRYFGWMRISVLNQNTIVVKDYAYNSTPGGSIIAGSIIVPSEKLLDDYSITSSNNNILVESFLDLQKSQIYVYDLLGKLIVSQAFSGTQTEISIDKKGIYIVEISSDKSVIRKKVYVY